MADLSFVPDIRAATRSGVAAVVRPRVPVTHAPVTGEHDSLEPDRPYPAGPDPVASDGEPGRVGPDSRPGELPVFGEHSRSSRSDAAGTASVDSSFLDEILAERASPGGGERQTIIQRVGSGLAGRLPHTLRGGLVDPAIRGALLIALVALVAALAAGWFAWRGRPVPVLALPPAAQVTDLANPGHGTVAGAVATAAPPSSAATGSPQAQVVVDVAGKVHHPGVLTLPGGSRVVDAVARAGGVLPGTDTSGLALARRLVDGEQILVDGRPGPAPPQPAGGAAGSAGGTGAAGGGSGRGSPGAAPGAPVNLNTATVEALDALPGVGPVLAQRIVEWRVAHGGFASPRQLGEVTGVGDQRLADLLPLVTV